MDEMNNECVGTATTSPLIPLQRGTYRAIPFQRCDPQKPIAAPLLPFLPYVPWSFLLALTLAAASAQTPQVDFNRDIRPVLAERCFQCHGPDAGQRKAELRLDIEADAKKKVIVAGKPDESAIIARISSTDPDERMPHAESRKPPLTPAQVELFRAWIAQGAKWSQHWAFVPVATPALPVVSSPGWPANDIDHFVLARLDAEGLRPSPEADRATLLRRASFDLIGLPPTLAELDAFVNDTSPGAFESAIDRLMASPHYGERMALDWLDGARYADTNGFQNDFQREMWPWRDWTIAAFNENMPYDRFTVEQLAGDMLPEATQSQKIASGFNRNNRSNTEGGSIEAEWYVENRIDRVETTSTVFLGLTYGCARCHDHKFDPISQKDFYRFYAFFNSSADKGFYEETRGNAGPLVMLPTEENTARIAEFEGRIATAERDLEKAKTTAEMGFEFWAEALPATLEPLGFAPVFSLPLAGDLGAAVYPGPDGPVWSDGLLGKALELNGTAEAHVDLGQAVEFRADAPFSVSAWIRPQGAGAVFSKMDDANGFRGVDILLGAEGEFAVHLVNHFMDDAIKAASDKRLEFGVWTHLCVTYDGSGKAAGVRAFANGHPVPLKPDVDTLKGPIDTEQPLRIGRRSSGSFFNGGISAFQVFDRRLTEGEANTLMRNALSGAVASPSAERTEMLRRFYALRESYEVRKRQERLDQAREAKTNYVRNKVTTTMVMEEAPEAAPTYRLVRGQYDQPDTSEVLAPGLPPFLPSLPEGTNNRLGLARWMVDPGNPLTARVAANRIWAKFFGRGLVTTLDNFGTQSAPPSHPELLDWLANSFVSGGWDMKALQKQVMMSAAYRQRSSLTQELLERDPENTLYARGPRSRLPAELIRDNALAVSGLLTQTIGGPSARPYQPEGLWAEIAGGAGEGPYVQSKGEDLYRRGLYTYRKRTVSHPTVSTFDAPSWEMCRAYRARTNTPLQALALLNDVTYVEAARGLARRMLEEALPNERIRFGFRSVTGRAPNQAEEEALAEGLRGYREAYAADPAAAEQFTKHGESAAPEHVDRVELAAYTAVAGVLLNMDEAITKE